MRDDLIQRLAEANPVPSELPAPSFDQVRGAIIRDGEGPVPDDSAAGRRSRRHIGAAIPIVTVLVAVVVAAGAILLIGHSSQPTGPSTSRATRPPVPALNNSPALRAISDARHTANKQDHACQLSSPQAITGRASGTPDQQLLDQFHALTLPKSATPIHIPSDATSGRVFGDYARIATQLDGTPVVVYPVHEVFDNALGSASCQTRTYQALLARLSHSSAALRAQSLQIWHELIADNAYISRHPNAGICLTSGRLGSSCNNLLVAAVRGELLETPTATAYLVPNAVARVTVYYAPITHSRRSPHRRSAIVIHANVVNNVATWKLKHPNTAFPTRITWQTANGTTTRTVHLQ
jgi:hypothetical protein